MSDDGYTLVEMLVALVMVGLATGGLSLAARHVAETERRVRGQHDIGLQLDRLRNTAGADLASGGPYAVGDGNPTTLNGDRSTVRYDCKVSGCALALAGPVRRQIASVTSSTGRRDYPLTGLGPLSWSYVSARDGRQTSAWPPQDRSDSLASIALLNASAPILVLRTPMQQPSICTFDAASHTCLPAGSP